MRVPLLIAAVTFHPAAPPPATAPAPPPVAAPPAPAPTPVPANAATWELVAECETGGNWSMEGPLYSGGLGMLDTNWIAGGGLAYAPNAGEATPDQQMIVASHFQTPPPYQDTPAGGCRGW